MSESEQTPAPAGAPLVVELFEHVTALSVVAAEQDQTSPLRKRLTEIVQALDRIGERLSAPPAFPAPVAEREPLTNRVYRCTSCKFETWVLAETHEPMGCTRTHCNGRLEPAPPALGEPGAGSELTRHHPFVVSAMEDAFYAGEIQARDPRPVHIKFAAWKRGEKAR